MINDQNLMLEMLQQMMKQQELMTRFMMQQMQTGQTTAPPVTQAPAEVIIQENGRIVDLEAQLASMRNEMIKLKEDNARLQTELEQAQQQATKGENQELIDLKKTVARAEAYLGKSIEDIAEEGAQLGGDDYYEQHKSEWNREGLTGKEKHDKISSYRSLFKDDVDNVIEF